jgi:two-component system chemotaxis sensor kinase CheA
VCSSDLAIDRVLGQQEIVVRPFEDPLVKVAGVAGTTDLGDGQPTLVLDLVGLSNIAVRAARAGAAA